MKIINDTEINEKQSLRSPRRFYKCQYAIGKCPRGGIINLTQFLGHYHRLVSEGERPGKTQAHSEEDP